MGSSPQFSTEIVESLHRPMAKDPYRATNRKEFVGQMCRVMDRVERIHFSLEFLTWAVVEMRRREIEREFASHSPGYQRTLMDVHEEHYIVKSRAKQPVEGLTVSKRPAFIRMFVPDVLVSYQITDFTGALARYLASNHRNIEAAHGESLTAVFAYQIKLFPVFNEMKNRTALMNVWLQLRLRLLTIQDESELADAKTVQAHPPIKAKKGSYSPSGRCHCVLVHDDQHAQAVGIQGARDYHNMPVITDRT
jgi:hypothetical protein